MIIIMVLIAIMVIVVIMTTAVIVIVIVITTVLQRLIPELIITERIVGLTVLISGSTRSKNIPL